MKVVGPTGCPLRDFVNPMSVAFTAPLPFTSPTSTRIGMVTLVEPFTLLSVTAIVWALATLVNGMVTTLPLVLTWPPLPIPPLPMVPLPEVTAACGLAPDGDVGQESEHDGVIPGGTAAAAFHSGCPAQGQIDIEIARVAVRLARDRALHQRRGGLRAVFPPGVELETALVVPAPDDHFIPGPDGGVIERAKGAFTVVICFQLPVAGS